MKKLWFLAIVSLICVFTLLNSSNNAFSAELDLESATKIIRQFTNNPTLELKDVPNAEHALGVHERTFVTPDGSAIFTLDEVNKIVTTAIVQPDAHARLATPLSLDQGQALAETVVQQQLGSTNGLNLHYQANEDHAAAGTLQRFEWVETRGSANAITPNRVMLTIDPATGTVVSYSRIVARAIDIDPEPKINYQQALEIVAKQNSFAFVERSHRLDIWWEHNDRSKNYILRWVINIEAKNSAKHGITEVAQYVINAHNGDIIEVLR